MVRRFALTVVAVLMAGVGSLGLSPQPTENAFTGPHGAVFAAAHTRLRTTPWSAARSAL